MLVFCGGDRMKDCPLFYSLGIHFFAAKYFFHDLKGVIRIVDRKISGESQKLRMPPQDPHAAGVECHDPDLPGFKTDHIIDAAAHFSCCLVRKGDGQDL